MENLKAKLQKLFGQHEIKINGTIQIFTNKYHSKQQHQLSAQINT